MCKRQPLWEGINELGDAGRESHRCAHRGVGEKRGEHLGLGQHSLPALSFLPSYGIECEGIQGTEFEATLPSLIESRNIFYVVVCWQCGPLCDHLPQALHMLKVGLWS